jgi:DNA polymerase-3 subunit delta
MKIAPRDANRFVKAPGEDVIAVLVYGPDSGLVRERAEALTRAVAETLDDPFRVVTLGPAELRDDPARLADEAQALAFGGGRRVVRLRGATNGNAETLSLILKTFAAANDPSPALIIAEAGELRPADKLRKLFENDARAAAVACYLDDSRNLEQVITETLARHKMRASPDALAWLGRHLGADRRLTRLELEKLALYCAGQNEVSLDDCAAVIGDGAGTDLDEAVFAAASGEFAALDTALARAFREGVSPVTVIRATMRHLHRLHLVTGLMAEGTPLDTATKSLKPNLFFKVADKFRAQARSWPEGHVRAALEILSEAEIRCKSTGLPDQLICARALMQIAQAGRRAKRA